MSCNCPTPNTCPETQQCLCGITLDIYNSQGTLVESTEAAPYFGNIFVDVQSVVWNSILGQHYELTIQYNNILGRWELSYFNNDLNQDIVIGVLYGDDTCPASNCNWDLDCISSIVNYKEFNTIFTWNGEYVNGKKSYEWTDIVYGTNFVVSWGPAPLEALAPPGTECWTIYYDNGEPVPVYPLVFLFSDTQCPFGNYIASWTNPVTLITLPDLGVTGFDLKTSIIDCGCCDESVIIDVIFGESIFNNIVANVVKDEYGNVLAINGHQYYSFELPLSPEPSTFYLVYIAGSWIMSNAIVGEFINYANLASTNDCPFGFYSLQEGPVGYFSVKGSECFDCCDYYTPRNRNLLKKKKAIFVDEISSIRNKEIFGMKCGPEWSDLFKKHLIFDVMWCLPYGVLCDDEEQCLINNLNENCNC